MTARSFDPMEIKSLAVLQLDAEVDHVEARAMYVTASKDCICDKRYRKFIIYAITAITAIISLSSVT
jgi:hypothetical protein